MASVLRLFLILGVGVPATIGLSGCSSTGGIVRDGEPYRSASIERDAKGLDEEAAPLEKAGRALVAIVVVGLAVGVIVLPLLLLL